MTRLTEGVQTFFRRALMYAQARLLASPVSGDVCVRNNIEWFRGLGMLEFLRTVGTAGRVNTMLSRDRHVLLYSLHVADDRLTLPPVCIHGWTPSRAYPLPNSRTSSSRRTTF